MTHTLNSTRDFTNIGEVVVIHVIDALAASVVSVLSATEYGYYGYSYNAEASRKFVTNLLLDSSAFADFIAENIDINLIDPLDVNGDYSD